jgi:uncharacterized membrane protein YcaP (DUF421 family)
MNFFQGQETLSTMDWVLRAAVAFFIMLITVRVMGLRTISQLRAIDFVIAFMLGNIIAHPLSDHSIGMKGSIISTIVLAFMYVVGVFLTQKWRWLRKVLDSEPVPLINNGEISYNALKKARISIDYLLSELRKEKVEDVKKVALALWETDGTISIFLDPKYQPITPETYQVMPEPFELPKVIISDGKINYTELDRIKMEESWLIKSLKESQQTEVNQVLLATIDNKNNLQVFLYK